MTSRDIKKITNAAMQDFLAGTQARDREGACNSRLGIGLVSLECAWENTAWASILILMEAWGEEGGWDWMLLGSRSSYYESPRLRELGQRVDR